MIVLCVSRSKDELLLKMTTLSLVISVLYTATLLMDTAGLADKRLCSGVGNTRDKD